MIYVHVPFCKKFCTYCDFYSEIAGEGCFKAYADGFCAEIRQRAKEMDVDPKTLYFGGGTPSVLPLSVLTRILITLDEVGHGGPYREFTMEVNPEDLVEKGKGYVDSLLSLGVNRLSIGVQSFDDGMLQWMNRRHDAAGAKEAFRLAREAGAENISLVRNYMEQLRSILQKNGFRRVGERWGCGDELNSYYFGNGQDIDIHLPTNSDKYMLVIRDHVSPDPDYQLILRLKYVHKLQHALKEYKYEKITIKL